MPTDPEALNALQGVISGSINEYFSVAEELKREDPDISAEDILTKMGPRKNLLSIYRKNIVINNMLPELIGATTPVGRTEATKIANEYYAAGKKAGLSKEEIQVNFKNQLSVLADNLERDESVIRRLKDKNEYGYGDNPGNVSDALYYLGKIISDPKQNTFN